MDVQTALQNLIDALKAAVDEKKSAGIQAFEAGDYDVAKQAANQAKAMDPIVKAVDHITIQWAVLQEPQKGVESKKSDPKKSDSKKADSKPLESTDVDFVIPILEVLEDEGGKGPTNEVLDKVKLILKDQLKPDDYELLDDGQTIRWRESAQKSIKKMIKKGLLHSKSPKGELRITPQGRLYFFEQQK